MADEPWLKYQAADGPWKNYEGTTATRAPDIESPGPWPEPPTEPPKRHDSAIGHVVRATGAALAPPYGPTKEELAPYVEGGVPIVNAFNRAIIGPVGTVLDIAGRPFQAAVRGGAATVSELARALGQDETQANKLEHDLNLGGDITLMLGGTAPVTKLPKPPTVGPISRIGRIDASEQAKQTIGAGFVLPPAEASEGHIGQANLTNAAAAEGGKIKMAQLASAKNQPLVNVYARTDLGLPAETPLLPQAFNAVRAREGQIYQEVANAVPEVDLGRSPTFREAVDKVGARSEETERLFPSTKEPPGIPALRAELVANSRGSTRAVMDYIADLRKNATANFQKEGDAMAHRMGAAQRQAANVLEDAMEESVRNAPDYFREKLESAQKYRDDIMKERPQQGLPLTGPVVDEANANVQQWADKLANANAQNQPNQTLLDRFRQARQTMAKSYDVEAVTNVSTGDVSAMGLGRLLQQGKPLTGNLKLIADSANSFARAFQNPAKFGGVESYSVLDAAAGTTAAIELALHGHPLAGGAAAAGAIGARPLVRKAILSPWYQRRMISEPTPSETSGIAQSLGRGGAITAGGEGLPP